MKTCNGCKYAEWRKTEAGRLHPSGDGKCAYEYKVPPLPAVFYWTGAEPHPCGGYITKREVHKEQCPYWSPTMAEQAEKEVTK